MARSIALAMIVKDEADHLAECLTSSRNATDEIHVVDTGSRDDTVAIAQRFGARVECFPWTDDFSAARNAALSQCSADWVLVLDADERLTGDGCAAIRALAEGPAKVAYRMTTRNYTNTASVSEFCPCTPGDPLARGFSGWFPSAKVRLFPNHTGATYAGPVHELIRPALEERGIAIRNSDVPIHHYPLVRPAERIAAKRDLYLRLGTDKVRSHPNDPNAHAELGHQYADMGDYAKAAHAYRQALQLDPKNGTLLKDLGNMLHLLGRPTDAVRALRLAVQCDPALSEAWRNLGVIHTTQDEWQAAADCFARAVELGPAWKDGPRYLSVALDGAGKLREAATASEAAVTANPGSREALSLYADQMTRLHRPADARIFLERLAAEGRGGKPLQDALDGLSAPGASEG